MPRRCCTYERDRRAQVRQRLFVHGRPAKMHTDVMKLRRLHRRARCTRRAESRLTGIHRGYCSVGTASPAGPRCGMRPGTSRYLQFCIRRVQHLVGLQCSEQPACPFRPHGGDSESGVEISSRLYTYCKPTAEVTAWIKTHSPGASAPFVLSASFVLSAPLVLSASYFVSPTSTTAS